MNGPVYTPGLTDVVPSALQPRQTTARVTTSGGRHRAGTLVEGTYVRFVLILSLIFAGHFPCLAAKNAGPVMVPPVGTDPAGALPAGVGIFDTLFIATSGTFSVKGDLYLQESNVLGDGMLSLHGDVQQRIVSHNSQVMNLELTNPSLVKLTGGLRISESLIIKGGVLDAAQAHLLLCDSTKIKLIGGAKIISRPQLWAGLPPAGNMLSRMGFAADAVLPSLSSLSCVRYRREQVCYKPSFQQHQAVSLDNTSPPPETGAIY